MVWAYFLENQTELYFIHNQPIFLFIQECGIEEEHVFSDMMMTERNDLHALLGAVQTGDTVAVRSLVDLADSGNELVGVLRSFHAKGVMVVSLAEEWYRHEDGLVQVESLVGMVTEWSEKRRRLGMERARQDGRMGRKADSRKVEQVQRLKSAGLSAKEILELCGISRSTYYRYLKK